MFEILMLACFSLIVFSQLLPERQPAEDKKSKEHNLKKKRPTNTAAKTNHLHRMTRTETKPPCRNNFGRAV